MGPRPTISTLFPYTTLFRSACGGRRCVELPSLKHPATPTYGSYRSPRAEIGRASCREKSVDLGGRRIIKKKKTHRSRHAEAAGNRGRVLELLGEALPFVEGDCDCFFFKQKTAYEMP